MDNFTVLLDAPDTPTSEIQIAKIGQFKDARYGEFSITPEEVSAWNKNLEHLPGGKALIDFDHLSDKPSPHRNTKAAGWITNVYLQGDVPKAQVEWTPKGEEAIKNKDYLFFSPAYGDFSDETGTEYHDVLSGGALTNKPFLNMATVTLASADRVLEAGRVDEDQKIQTDDKTLDKSSSDTCSQMNITADTLKVLGIEDEATVKVILDLSGAEDADSAKVIEAIVAATPKVEVAPIPTKSLESQAKLEGKVVLDSADVSKLLLDAAAGAEAKKELDASKFDTAFDEAVRSGQASPSQREQYAKFYALDSATTLESLENAPKIVNVTPAGQSKNPEDAPAGVHESSYQLDQRVQAYMKENKLPQSKYLEALDTVGAEA